LFRRLETGQLLLENNAPTGFESASVDPKIDALNSGVATVLVGYEGLSAAGRSPWRWAGALHHWCLSQEDGTTRTRDLQVSSDQQSAGADCGDLRWATEGLDFSEERSGGSPRKAGRVARLERRAGGLPREAGRVSTWVDDRGAT